MSQIASEIIVHAPQQVVWEVLTHMEHYSRWNSQFRLISGRVGEGERLTLRYCPLYCKSYVFKSQVHQFVPQKSFGWKGVLLLPGMLNVECIFDITAVDEQNTQLNFYQGYSGIMAWALLRAQLFRDTRKSCIKLNADIKQRVESVFTPKAVLSA